MTKKLLTFNLSDAGKKFVVGNRVKDTTFPPGTSGYTSFILGPDYENPNIVFKTVVTTRRGMKGKERLNKNIVLFPLITIDNFENDTLLKTEEERKFLIDIKMPENVNSKSMLKAPEIKFMGWLLAKTLFLKELDKVMYPSHSKIMSMVKLNGGKQMTAWKENEKTLISKFSNIAEDYFNEGREMELAERFCGINDRVVITKELAQKEVLLVVPKLEYQRKTCEVLLDALQFVKTVVSDTKDMNKDNIIKEINLETETYKEQEQCFTTAIDNRLHALITK